MKNTIWLLLPVLFVSCLGTRMQPEELFLTSEETANIMIISYLPDHPEETNVTLLITPPADTRHGSTAFMTSINGKERISEVYFNDSIPSVKKKVFPVVLRRHNETTNGFDFYLYRNKLLFTGLAGRTRTFMVEFAKQHPFTTDSTSNGIFGFTPINTGKNETGKLFIHVLSNPDSLFKKGIGTRYCWIDYTIRDEGFTLYYSQTATGQKTRLYSTGNPTFAEQTGKDDLVTQIVQPSGQTIEFRPVLTEHFQPQKSGFVSTSAAVFEGEEQVGTAVIYYLTQP